MHDVGLDHHSLADGQAAPAAEASEATEREPNNELVATVATVAVVGVGAALFEAALLPGIVLGVAAMAVPHYLPKMGAALSPLLRSTVRSAYKVGQKTREFVAEAQEQVHDIVAEVKAEDSHEAAPKGHAAANGGASA